MREILPENDKTKKGNKTTEIASAISGNAQEGREANRGVNKNVTRDGDREQESDISHPVLKRVRKEGCFNCGRKIGGRDNAKVSIKKRSQ